MWLRLAGLWLLLLPLKSFGAYILTPNCKEAYRLTWQFNVPEALALLDKESANNQMALHLRESAYFIKAFATEAPDDIKAFRKENARALSLFSSKDDYQGLYYYCRAEALLHSALISIKQSEYLSAANDINKAYRLLSSGADKYPQLLLLQKDLLLLKAAIGSVPDSYAWMVRILGFSGNLKKDGAAYIALLPKLRSNDEYALFYPEAGIYCAYIQYYLLNDAAGAWNTLHDATADYSKSAVKAFFRAAMALRLKKNEEAATILAPFVRLTPQITLSDYQYGLTLLQRCDKSSAAYFARFITNYKGQNYIKDAYLRMGWAFLLNNDLKNYHNCMLLVKKYGSASLEEDANALQEASRTAMPDMNLLKARLYYDGGYYDEAYEQLKIINIANLNTYNQAEYYYRSGRVLEALGQTDKALFNYTQLINENKFTAQSYFTPAAYVYSAMIWEKRNNSLKAKALYQKVSTFSNYPYKNSFDQKAQSGLKRLE